MYFSYFFYSIDLQKLYWNSLKEPMNNNKIKRQNPYPQLLGFGASSLAIPLYLFFKMENPYKLSEAQVHRQDQFIR